MLTIVLTATVLVVTINDFEVVPVVIVTDAER